MSSVPTAVAFGDVQGCALLVAPSCRLPSSSETHRDPAVGAPVGASIILGLKT